MNDQSRSVSYRPLTTIAMTSRGISCLSADHRQHMITRKNCYANDYLQESLINLLREYTREYTHAFMHNVMKSFREALSNASNILILTGSGISAESGVPTFRGAGGFWRKYQAQSLATPEAFAANPSLVWEFYEYRRQLASKVKPNKAHEAVAEFQKRKIAEGKNVSIITQNIDGLHQRAGAQDVVELHGSLYRTRCTKCHNIVINENIPICPALAGKGSPDPNIMSSDIPKEELPLCEIKDCRALLRPDIIWFGEQLNEDILQKTFNIVKSCDACLVIGTSAIVYPAAMFAPQVARRNVPVAEFNIEETPATKQMHSMINSEFSWMH